MADQIIETTQDSDSAYDAIMDRVTNQQPIEQQSEPAIATDTTPAVVTTETDVPNDPSITVDEHVTAEPAPVATEGITEEKIREVPVEKIVEKYPEFKSDVVKDYYDRITNGDESEGLKALADFAREKNRNYQAMSDVDVLRNVIKKEKPHWSKEDIDLKIADDYGDELVKMDLTSIDKEIEPEQYAEAVKFNKAVERNLIRIGRDAKDARQQLLEAQANLQLPKIEKAQPQTKPEEPSAEAIAEANRVWASQVEDETKDFKSLPVRIGDRQITFNISEADRNATLEEVKSISPQKFFESRGWIKDGKSNPAKIAEDIFKLNNFEKVTNAYYNQGSNTGKRDALKDIKNITPNTPATPASYASTEEEYDAIIERSRNKVF